MKLMVVVKNREESLSSSILVNLDIGTLCFSRNSDAVIDYISGGQRFKVISLDSEGIFWKLDDLNCFWDRFCAGIMCLENCNHEGVRAEINIETLDIDWYAFDKKDSTYKMVKMAVSREGVCSINYSIPVIFKDRLKLSR